MRIVANAIRNLDVAKATGPECFESVFPSCCKFSFAVNAYKSCGERSDYGNYHPISLLPIMGKILESFVNDRISKYLH